MKDLAITSLEQLCIGIKKLVNKRQYLLFSVFINSIIDYFEHIDEEMEAMNNRCSKLILDNLLLSLSHKGAVIKQAEAESLLTESHLIRQGMQERLTDCGKRIKQLESDLRLSNHGSEYSQDFVDNLNTKLDRAMRESNLLKRELDVVTKRYDSGQRLIKEQAAEIIDLKKADADGDCDYEQLHRGNEALQQELRHKEIRIAQLEESLNSNIREVTENKAPKVKDYISCISVIDNLPEGCADKGGDAVRKAMEHFDAGNGVIQVYISQNRTKIKALLLDLNITDRQVCEIIQWMSFGNQINACKLLSAIQLKDNKFYNDLTTKGMVNKLYSLSISDGN